MSDVPARVRRAVAGALGEEPDRWWPVTGGHSPAGRMRAGTAGGRTVFAKWATEDLTAGWLRQERVVLEAIEHPCLPRLLAWQEDALPVLVLEDLGAATWPPPWSDELAHRGKEALAEIARLQPPPAVPSAEVLAEFLRGWTRVESDPKPLLATGCVDEQWLEAALPALRQAEDAASFTGTALLHNDARGDNMAFLPDGRTVLVDWNWAAAGPAELDLAYFANHVHATGGPTPEVLMPNDAGWAAVIAGYFAAEAGLAPVPGSPTIRPLQLQHLKTALPWAVRTFELPPLAIRST